MVNFHGSTGYGQAFAESIVGAHGDKPFADVMAATDAQAALLWWREVFGWLDRFAPGGGR